MAARAATPTSRRRRRGPGRGPAPRRDRRSAGRSRISATSGASTSRAGGGSDETAYADTVALGAVPARAGLEPGRDRDRRRARRAPRWAGSVDRVHPPVRAASWARSASVSRAGLLPGGAWVDGLKVAAVAVVAHAVWSMARTLTPDLPRAALALAAAAVALARPDAVHAGRPHRRSAPLAGIAPPAPPRCRTSRGRRRRRRRRRPPCHGAWRRRRPGPVRRAARRPAARRGPRPATRRSPSSRRSTAPGRSSSAAGTSSCRCSRPASWRRAGSARTRSWPATGRRRRCPGRSSPSPRSSGRLPPGPFRAACAGAVIATVAIFLPGALLVVGALPFWHALRVRPGARAALAGVNAAVVGLLAAALIDPVARSGITGSADVVVAAAGFGALLTGRVPPLAVVIGSVAATVVLRAVGV